MESDTDPDVPDVVTRPATMYTDPELPVTTLPVDTVTVPLTPVTVESPVTMDTAPLPPPADLPGPKEVGNAKACAATLQYMENDQVLPSRRGYASVCRLGSHARPCPVPMLRAHHAHACLGLDDALPRG